MKINTNIPATPIIHETKKEHNVIEKKELTSKVDKVEIIKEQIANGTYKIDLQKLSEQIADKLL